jgi:hypothetical protein
MFRSACLGAAICAAGLGCIPRAQAHVIVGPRVFPVTLTIDDPGVADEATLPQVVLAPGSDGSHDYAIQWEYDKTITPTTALIYNQGYDILTQRGAKTATGFENVVITGKWQAYTNANTESVVSLGVIREFGGGAATQSIGGDSYGATAPTIYFGQGGGFLPVPLLRPLAVTGELSYFFADRRLNSSGDNNGNPDFWSGGIAIQYSIPYLQSQVRDIGLTGVLGDLIPLVELTYSTPADGPAYGNPPTFTIGAGAIYLAGAYQVGLEMLIPGNTATGAHVGFVAQVHVFLDDMFPNSIGKPLFQ